MKIAFSIILKRKFPALFIGAFVLLHAHGFGDELRESYIARLSARDHFSSKGERLQSAAAIIRQDRANFYIYDIRDPEDEPDAFFANKGNRERLEQLLEHGSSERSAVRHVLNGTPLIKVMIYRDNAGRDYINVTVISDY
jgi:hypothetical protein